MEQGVRCAGSSGTHRALQEADGALVGGTP